MSKDSILSHFEPQEIERQLMRIPFYVRFSSISKLALGVMVIAMIMMVVVLPFLQPDDEGFRLAIPQDTTLKAGDNPVMKNPRFESVDAKNQPFTIRALQAIQLDADRVELQKINADVSLNSGLWLALQAQKGVLNITTSQMELNDQVQLFASNGYELRTPKAMIDMKANHASSDQGVKGQGPLGSIKADSFLIEGQKQRLLFNRNVKLVIYP